MGTIYAVNDLPHSGDESREADFRTKITLATDPHTGFLKPGHEGKMESDHIKEDHDYVVEAQVKIAVHRDIHVSIDNVKKNQKVVLRHDGDQYILSREA